MLIHNAVLTGSFSYAGADLSNISASADYSASLSTRTTNLETASGSFSTRLTAVSSSQQQISSSQQQISASLLNVIATGATTGSNSFRADQSITGSLVVSSTITAQTLVVQTVTSSIVYSSGSNNFGNQLANTQTFTGSVNITGSLNVVTTGTEFQVTNTGVILGNLSTDNHAITGSLNMTGSLGINAASSFRFNGVGDNSHAVGYDATVDGAFLRGQNGIRLITGGGSGIERMRISAAGTASFTSNTLSNSADAATINLKQNSTTANTGIYLERSGEQKGYYIYMGGSVDSLTFQRNNAGTKADVMSLTRDGNVFINNSSGVSLNGLTNFLSVSSTTYNLFDISRFSDNAFGPNFYLVKSRNGSIGGNTIVANGDNLGNITWVGANGTGFTDAANIRAEVDGTPGASNDMPGRLVFSTTADGSGSTTERMRITSAGYVGIDTDGTTAKLGIGRSANTESNIFLTRNTTTADVNVGCIRSALGPYWYDATSTSLAEINLQTDTTAYYKGAIMFSTNNSDATANRAALRMYINAAGSIGTTKNGTNIYNASDVRLKENIVTIENGLDKILQLNPVKFNWIDGFAEDGKDMLGFIAQEVQSIIPEVVEDFGGEDNIVEIGDLKVTNPLRINEKFIIPVLVKAIQELKAEFDTYKETHP